MRATVIQQPALRLIVAKSASFPEGNRAAFESLENHLDSLRGRRFYGLVDQTEAGLAYAAGLVPLDEAEATRFVELGFEIREIEAGPCARTKLTDWADKTDQIGSGFSAMAKSFAVDPSRPQMEFYRSLSELHLLLQIMADGSGRRQSL